jgi:UDP-glucose 4-epimerase
LRVFVAGGAGFIGSHTVARLLGDTSIDGVTVYDNLSSGKREYLPENEPRLTFVEADLSSLDTLCGAMVGHDLVFHYASNPDIARAAREPDIDFWQGTYLTQNIVEAMRRTRVREIVYASGSGVYGDTGFKVLGEDHSPLLPISTYGASKLAGEMLICSYCHMFSLQAWVFRFANVVGPRQTHGVVFDFIHRLKAEPASLSILGDGTQSKSYIHIEDVLDGIWLARKKADAQYNYFNLSTDDHITVSEIAGIVTRTMGLGDVRRAYSGGDRGWKGDVPVVRLDTAKIKKLGWRARYSTWDAIRASACSIYEHSLLESERATGV